MYKNNYPHKRYRITLDFLKKHVNSNEEILDLGVANPFSEILKNNNYKVKFVKSPIAYPELINKTTTDFAYLDNDLYLIARGQLLIYNSLTYSFKPFGSVRSITENAVGHYHEFEDWQFDWLLEKSGC